MERKENNDLDLDKVPVVLLPDLSVISQSNVNATVEEKEVRLRLIGG